MARLCNGFASLGDPVVAANPLRQSLLIQNRSATGLYINVDGDAEANPSVTGVALAQHDAIVLTGEEAKVAIFASPGAYNFIIQEG